ncbi:MAG TPA: hypothetical protein VKZ75_03735 [Cyclobacteriaceae bacterium]|nr:hypothetical protein [Cyclobacteriaceae bacterium]
MRPANSRRPFFVIFMPDFTDISFFYKKKGGLALSHPLFISRVKFFGGYNRRGRAVAAINYKSGAGN